MRLMRPGSGRRPAMSRFVAFFALAAVAHCLFNANCVVAEEAAKDDVKDRSAPQWRVVEDAPYRVVPGNPVLVPEGEDPRALGSGLFIDGRSSYYSAAFSPDGRFIAFGSSDTTIKLWDVAAKALVHAFEGHSGPVYAVAFSPDGRFIASGAGFYSFQHDNSLKLWDLKTKALVHSFKGHSNTVQTMAFSPDSRFLASGSGDYEGQYSDNTVKLWDLETKALVHTFKGHSSDVRSAAFSPDGRFIASGSSDKTVKLWDLTAKALAHTFKGHSRGVNSVAFSPDGRFIASGSDDDTIKLWDLAAKKEIQELKGGMAGNWVVRDDQNRLYRGDDGTLLLKHADRPKGVVPVPPAGMSARDDLSIVQWPPLVTVQAGESKAIQIRVKNNGASPAFWVGLKPGFNARDDLRIDPPDPSFKGRGRQSWIPWRVAKLRPGETALLHARITPNLKLPSAFIESGRHNLEVTVVTANHTEVSQTLAVDLQTPDLVWQRARLAQDGKTLNVELINKGTADLRDFSLSLHSADPDSKKGAAATALEQLKLPLLAAGAAIERPFSLPEGLDLKTAQLTLQGRTQEIPLFSWNLASPGIRRTGYVLYIVLGALLVVVSTALFYARRYRHPLLVQLTRTPGQLLALPVEQLVEARTRLRQTGRLDKVLSEAQVGARTFDQAAGFAHGKNDAEMAQWIAGRLGTAAREIQPALWEIGLPDRFPLNLDRCLLHFGSADDEPGDLPARVKALATGLSPILLMGPDSGFQRKLLPATRDRTNKLVAPTGSEITRLLLHPEPERVLAEILSAQLSLIQLSPYQLGGGIHRESFFFGRQQIIAHIMNRDPANYLVVGGRQLGKTSLLKALERRYAGLPGVTCCYLGLGDEVLSPRLAHMLGIDPADGLDGVADYLRRQSGRFLFLIDEADHFIRYERQTDYHTLAALRRMSEEGLANFILAGFWQLYDHAVMDYQSPLKNFAETIQIGELESEACRQLAVVPMQNMRLTYEDPALVERILGATGQRANLVATVCHQIISRLKPDQRTIRAGDVQQALYSRATLDALGGWQSMTEDQQACRLDRLVVYATVENARFDLAALASALNRHGLTPGGDQLERSLARLQLGFVLGRNDQGKYFYRVPLFRDMVLQDDPAAKLELDVHAWLK